MLRVIPMLGIAAALLAAGSANAATIFNFQFDNQGVATTANTDGPIVPPVVGTGTFVSPVDLAPGMYALSTLPGFTMRFSFANGDSYTEANVATPLTGAAVKITSKGTAERLFFTESGNPGSDGGPTGGALDLVNGSSALSFEPSFFGGNIVYFESGNSVLSGRYLALGSVAITTPEPTATALLFAGLVGLGALRRRSR